MAKQTGHKRAPALRPKRPLHLAILRCLGRWTRWLAARAIGLWIWVVDAAIAGIVWPYRNPIRSSKLAWGGLWRLATALSVGYLVFDRLYETSATLTVPAPDAFRVYAFPFAITNNSHLFSIENVIWKCEAKHIKTDRGTILDNVSLINGRVDEISPGQTLNVNCNKFGAGTLFGGDLGLVVEGVMIISLKYDVPIFGIWTWGRTPEPTVFTVFSDTPAPKWMKGPLAP